MLRLQSARLLAARTRTAPVLLNPRAIVGRKVAPVVSPEFSSRRWFSQEPSDKEREEATKPQENANGDVLANANKRIVELETELKKAKQELLYSLADQENTRRIAKKDVADARAFGAKEFAKSLLDVADTLQKAIETMSSLDSTDAKVQSFVQGVKATEVNMLKALKSNGVEAYGAPGDKFDPNVHEALAKVPDPTKPPNSLYQVLRRGWSLNGRVLRPAQVITTTAVEIDHAFLERKVSDKVDEADEEEIIKNKNTKA